MTDTTFTAKKITRMGTRNGGTLHQSGRLNQLLEEFEQHRLDLLGISEVRWTGSGEMTSDGKKILYSCNDKKHDRQGFEDVTGPFASSKCLSDNG